MGQVVIRANRIAADCFLLQQKTAGFRIELQEKVGIGGHLGFEQQRRQIAPFFRGQK